MADTENQSYPFLPESNWWTLREQFAKTLPNTVSLSYIKSLLSLGDKPAKQRISHLQKIGLVDDKGKPTGRANEWRSDQKYRDVCNAIIAQFYPQEFVDLFSDPATDRVKIEEWFKFTEKIGEAGAKKYAQFFLLLRDSKAEESGERLKLQASKPTVKKEIKSRNANITPDIKPSELSRPVLDAPETVTGRTGLAELPNSGTTEASQEENWLSLHVDLQIHISPDASAAQIDQIFASMAKHLVSMKRDKTTQSS